MRSSLRDCSSLVFPLEAFNLLRGLVHELAERVLSPVQLIVVLSGTLWAIFNATWAMVYGLNRAYEVEECRSRLKKLSVIAGLSLSAAAIGSVAILVMSGGEFLLARLHCAALYLRTWQWVVLCASLFIWFGVLYRFAPNLRDHEWRWSTPGALCALVLWIGCTLTARLYFDYVNNYSRSYGHLNSVTMLLLWLYITNGTVLIGGELNSEIQKAAAEASAPRDGVAKQKDRSGS